MGQYDNCYESEIEIDRLECETRDSNCDCPYNYDCQHLAALIFYLEENLDSILVAFSKENNLKQLGATMESTSRTRQLLEKIKQAESKIFQQQEEQHQSGSTRICGGFLPSCYITFLGHIKNKS